MRSNHHHRRLIAGYDTGTWVLSGVLLGGLVGLISLGVGVTRRATRPQPTRRSLPPAPPAPPLRIRAAKKPRHTRHFWPGLILASLAGGVYIVAVVSNLAGIW